MSEQTEERKHELIKHVQDNYPGLRVFVQMSRDATGITMISLYDLDAAPLDPVYVIGIHPRDLLICGCGFLLPALAYQQYQAAGETGEFPPGYIPATYGAEK